MDVDTREASDITDIGLLKSTNGDTSMKDDGIMDQSNHIVVVYNGKGTHTPINQEGRTHDLSLLQRSRKTNKPPDRNRFVSLKGPLKIKNGQVAGDSKTPLQKREKSVMITSTDNEVEENSNEEDPLSPQHRSLAWYCEGQGHTRLRPYPCRSKPASWAPSRRAELLRDHQASSIRTWFGIFVKAQGHTSVGLS
ncbi:hypothetical protein Syun_014064 [Stephania yunnanensis]|uniref:Uncharacterized protein n=1 Tax=Stephania yunnanensis TaxID=152371 RepID=A0AAP0JJ17_9MAGN